MEADIKTDNIASQLRKYDKDFRDLDALYLKKMRQTYKEKFKLLLKHHYI